jgi:hypothetical protein
VVILAKVEMHAKIRVASESSEMVSCGLSEAGTDVCSQLEELLESFIFEPPLDARRMFTKTFRTSVVINS